MKILFSLLSLALISCSAHTEKSLQQENLQKIQGDYQGSGTSVSGTTVVACETVNFVISTTPSTLTIESINFVCNGANIFHTENPMVFDVVGNDLKVSGEKFGTYLPTTGITIAYNDGNIQYTLNFQSSIVPYKLVLTQTDGVVSKKLTASLNKRPLAGTANSTPFP